MPPRKASLTSTTTPAGKGKKAQKVEKHSDGVASASTAVTRDATSSPPHCSSAPPPAPRLPPPPPTDSFTADGCFRSPPRVYLELLWPIIGWFVDHPLSGDPPRYSTGAKANDEAAEGETLPLVPPPPPPPLAGSLMKRTAHPAAGEAAPLSAANGESPQAEAEKDDDKEETVVPVASVSRTTQLHTLASLIAPKGCMHLLHCTRLLTPPSPAPSLLQDGAADDATAPVSTGAPIDDTAKSASPVSRKRVRTDDAIDAAAAAVVASEEVQQPTRSCGASPPIRFAVTADGPLHLPPLPETAVASTTAPATTMTAVSAPVHDTLSPLLALPPAAQQVVAMVKEAGRLYLPPFADDSEYLQWREMCFILHHWSLAASSMTITKTVINSATAALLSFVEQVAPCIRLVSEIVHTHTALRVRGMAMEPRVIRVCRRLHMSAKETQALTYLLLCHCGSQLAISISHAISPVAIAGHNHLSPRELMHFLGDDRLHVKQGLIASDIKYRTNFVDCTFSMAQEAVSALVGEQLSEEQLIKLEKTAVAEELARERRTHTPSHASAHGNGSAVVDYDDDNDDGRRANEAEEEEEAVREGSFSSASASAVGDVDADETDETGVGGGDAMDGADSDGTMVVVTKEDGTQQTVPLSALKDCLGGGEAGAAAAAQLLEALQVASPAPGTSTTESVVPNRAAAAAAAASPAPEGGRTSAATTPTTAAAGAAGGGVATSTDVTPPPSERKARGGSPSSRSLMHVPYENDIDYMEEAFKVVANTIKARTAEGDMKDGEEASFLPKNKMEATLRELKGKVRVASVVHRSRVEATLQAKRFTPRIEELSQRLHLSDLEKQILLLMVGNVVSHDILIAINGRYVMRDGQRVLTVGYVLFVLCDDLKGRVASRKAFYQSSPLVSNGIISLSLDSSMRSCFNTDLMDYTCDIDRKIVDYLMGTETETSELVPGSSLYFPSVAMDKVVLPKNTTELVLSTIAHYSLFERCKRQCGFGEGLGTSLTGLVILFYGPSGTGKTMLANAVAHDLKKRLLLVNVAQFKADTKAPEMLRFVFREAKLNDAIIFFDECEGLFESRDSNPLVTSVLAEFEKYDGLVVLATNKAQIMDEAMNRRISLMIEFKLPDHEMREQIWRSHIPHNLPLAPDVSVERLSLNYELTGGLIRNAVLAALNHAVARDKSDTPTLRMEDFEAGAKLQLRGFFLAAERPTGGSSECYITPKRTLAELVVEPATRRQVESVANVAKSRSTLVSQWGFSEELCEDQGAVYLFSGHSGTGKSLAAEGIAYECGATVRLCNVSELMLHREINIQGVFEEGRTLGAIIVFDQAQVLFNHSERSVQVSQLIQYHAMRYPRPVIVIATTGSGDGGSGSNSVDVSASKLVFSLEVTFAMPTRALRKELWRKAFPDKVPLAPDVDLDALSETLASAKVIRTVAFNACCKVAMLPVKERVLTMKMVREELETLTLRERSRNSLVRNMFA